MSDFGELLLKLWKGGAQGLVVLFCFFGLLAVAPYVAQQYGIRPERSVARVEVEDWASERAKATSNLIAELHAGSAPRDIEFVPYWHNVLKIPAELKALRGSIDKHRESNDHLRSSNDNLSRKMAQLAMELEDSEHRGAWIESRKPQREPHRVIHEDESIVSRWRDAIAQWWSS